MESLKACFIMSISHYYFGKGNQIPLQFVIKLSDSELLVLLITVKPLHGVFFMYFIQILASMIAWKIQFPSN